MKIAAKISRVSPAAADLGAHAALHQVATRNCRLALD
jgi:hypothetical protein